MVNCVPFKIISNIVLMICGVGFVAIGGYYTYQLVGSIRDVDLTIIITNALALVMNNLLMIFIWLACIFRNRKLFMNSFGICFSSFIVTTVQLIFQVITKNECEADENNKFSLFCEMFMNYSFVGITVVNYVISIITGVLCLIRFIFHNTWEWD